MPRKPSFAVTEKNAQAIAEICHTLDGIPLALELAAARVRALPVEAIATRLSDRFRLLTGGDKTSLPRQQTLRACIDWSFDLLSQTEQSMLRRLAVFAGGWTLEAAERVGADPIVDVFEVVDLLTHLVEKSLVQLEADGGRYRLLETVRQYAKERLEEAGEKGQTRTRHLAFFVDLAEEASPHLMGPEQGEWLERLDLERENLLVAHTLVRSRRARRRAGAAPAERRARLLDRSRPRSARTSRDGGSARPSGREGARSASVPRARCGGVPRLFHGPLRGSEGLRGREPFDRARSSGTTIRSSRR